MKTRSSSSVGVGAAAGFVVLPLRACIGTGQEVEAELPELWCCVRH